MASPAAGDGPHLGSGSELPLAFLVDGDNASARFIPAMLAEAGKYGTVEIRRVYGEWTSPQLGQWKAVLQEHALLPIQQFSNATGKNATDSALIIDAMDILHGGRIRGFCIVSSDSDFTRLAIRLREAGMFVLGIGRAATPPAFRNSCNVFASVENLVPVLVERPPRGGRGGGRRGPEEPAPPGPPERRAEDRTRRAPDEAVPLLDEAFDQIVRDDGVGVLAELGNALLKLDPSFDSRTYGRAKLADLLKALPDRFTVEIPSKGTSRQVWIRRKGSKPPDEPAPG